MQHKTNAYLRCLTLFALKWARFVKHLNANAYCKLSIEKPQWICPMSFPNESSTECLIANLTHCPTHCMHTWISRWFCCFFNFCKYYRAITCMWLWCSKQLAMSLEKYFTFSNQNKRIWLVPVHETICIVCSDMMLTLVV